MIFFRIFLLFTYPVLFLSSCHIFSTGGNNDNEKKKSLVYSPILENQKKPLVGSEPFRLIDQFSTAHAMNNYKNKRSIFLIYINRDCFKNNEKRILNSYPQNLDSVSFFITRGVGEHYKDYQHIKIPVLFDDFQFVIEAYQLNEVGSFVEIQTSDNQVLARGKIPLENNTKLFGSSACKSTKNLIDPPVAFAKVQLLFASQCMWCHQRNVDIDYFKTMSSIQQWSKMMLKTMQTYRMPPGGIDTKLDFPQYGLARHEELLPLYKWLDQGALYTQEDEARLLKIRSKIEELHKKRTKFQGRDPDFVFKMSDVDKVPAEGDSFFINAELAGPFAEDTYLEAVQFENYENIVHHTVISLSSRKPKKRIIRTKDLWMSIPLASSELKTFSKQTNTPSEVFGTNILFGHMPDNRNSSTLHFGDGTAVFVPKGSYLNIENHYEPKGKTGKNQTAVSFYKYSKKEPPKKVNSLGVWNGKFSLAPNQSNLEIYTILPIERKSKLLSAIPHTHYRGKDFKLFLKKQGSASAFDMKLIFSVPFLLFKHPTRSGFKNPVDLNPGDELHMVIRYDNSIMNIGNPDPSKKIDVGISVLNNEMYSVIFTLLE